MGNNLDAITVIFTEFYYWVTVVFMFLIHVGFCMYEVGVSRRRNHLHTLMKNTMLIPLVSVTFYLFGWWLYFGIQKFPFGAIDFDLATTARPWSALMATHLSGPSPDLGISADQAALWHRLNGVFWAAFLLFSWTAASIVSGAVIERIQSGAFWILAILIGSGTWMVDAAWGWSSGGWMVEKLGYHDAYASGVIHAIAGGFALGVLVVLGPRLAKFKADGTPRDIPPHNVWLVTIGLFLIYTGFWGFYAACNVPMIAPSGIGGQITGETWTATNIYLAPTTLSAITFNFIMSLSGGLMTAYVISRGDPFWTYSGGLAGIIGASAGNDLYHPIQALFIGAITVWIIYKMHYWVERRFKIDDAVGAVAVHGYAGFLGVVIAGIMLWGQPSSPYEGFAHISPWGNFIGAIIMFGVLGFLPAWIGAKILNSMGLLRIPRKVELEGLDFESEETYRAAVDEVRAAEKAMVKA